ncbi:MAG: hypothetical protein ACOCQX_00795 [Candidatus Nanoarchaeia archaeon]
MLIGVRGSRALNDKLIAFALNSTPTLFIDCAGCSDIHRFKGYPVENFQRLYIVPAESLYRFLPTIKSIPELARQTDAEKIFISSFNHLFDYDDKEENYDIFVYAWQLLRKLGKEFDIFAGIKTGSVHEDLAQCKIIDESALDALVNVKSDVNMGHTINSQRNETDVLINELKQFGKSLSENDREIFDELIKSSLKHLGSISYTSSVNVWVFFLLSVIIEQEKKWEQEKNRVNNSKISENNVASRCVSEKGENSIMAQDREG